MANKKIFTGYTFEGGGQSKNLRLEAATSDPTNVGKVMRTTTRQQEP